MAGSVLSGRYVVSTDDFLSVTDEESLIEAADDPKGPGTSAKSFVELEAAATTGGAGSDADKVRVQILETISAAVATAETVIEAFGSSRYALPYAPVDSFIKTLVVRWAWVDLQARRGMLSPSDARAERDSITRLGDRIGDGSYLLTAGLISASTGEAVYAFGGNERRFSRVGFEGD